VSTLASIPQPLAVGVALSTGRDCATPRPSPLGKRIRTFLLLLLVAVFIRLFVGEAAVVPTSSMEGTILVGDHILLNKLAYGPRVPFTNLHLPRLKRIQRGEIVAFTYPKDPSLTFLKRVAAIGGDVVEIRDEILYVNHTPIREPYVVLAPRWQRQYGTMRPRVVPHGELFVLGDNRNNSDDSRFWGTVPEQNVVGEPFMVLWSYDAPSQAWLDEDPAAMLRFYSSIAANLINGTRWWRTGILL
jgi:signal peptidase I